MQQVEDIYKHNGEQAVLLLHSFTSNAKEMKHLAHILFEAGYTVYAPNLAGHGAAPERLFASSMDQIWQGAKQAFEHLVDDGYKQIAVIGQSLGGVLGMRLANRYMTCNALALLSSPVLERPIAGLEKRVEFYSQRYLQNNGATEEELENFLNEHFPRPTEKMIALQQFIVGSQREMSELKQPLFLAKGMLDEVVFHESIDLIASAAQSDRIVKISYEKSGHLITLGKEREKIAQDLLDFLANRKR
ncbi:alpha/beta hydrolase [Solibacillus daqui]|uniref:alpha/beta hydrolase n=1 Tax=Solibacillus daqui TaxID=2912187 RepID=UPI0023667E19|nr:alpha/beta fold hydrolase [Solibacillus daqui]